ncbi:MAG: Lrp/AsnC family transcriptional regulator [Aquificae bacterium]|nr:Lrp/AsnC family transcriptional regulator [Aquificota bacterium]
MIDSFTETEKAVLKELQSGIPIEKRPFKKIGEKLGLEEDSLIETVKQLKEKKIIRQISPIYDTKALGYESSLVAFKVEKDRIEDVAQEINKHPGVSHNYERNDSFNLWFTIAVPPDSRLGLEKTVELLAEITKAQDYALLKTVKLFKIGVKLDFGSLKEKEAVNNNGAKKNYKITEKDKEIIRITQKDMELVREPFEAYGRQLGMDGEEVIQALNTYRENGIMRRFAAILFHRKAGFKANGMTVWKVPEDRIEEVGKHLASYRAVTHCYQRTTTPNWQYNLFSMIHAQTKEELEQFVRQLSDEIGIKEYKILYSTREFKKKRVEYFSQKFYKWEEVVCYGKTA